MKLYQSHQRIKKLNEDAKKDLEKIPESGNTEKTVVIYETTSFMKWAGSAIRTLFSVLLFILAGIFISFGIAYLATHLF